MNSGCWALPPSTGRETIIIITGVTIITLLKRIFHNTISTVRVVGAAKSCEKLISTAIGGWTLRSAGPKGTVISLVQIETDWGIGCMCKRKMASSSIQSAIDLSNRTLIFWYRYVPLFVQDIELQMRAKVKPCWAECSKVSFTCLIQGVVTQHHPGGQSRYCRGIRECSCLASTNSWGKSLNYWKFIFSIR